MLLSDKNAVGARIGTNDGYYRSLKVEMIQFCKFSRWLTTDPFCAFSLQLADSADTKPVYDQLEMFAYGTYDQYQGMF